MTCIWIHDPSRGSLGPRHVDKIEHSLALLMYLSAYPSSRLESSIAITRWHGVHLLSSLLLVISIVSPCNTRMPAWSRGNWSIHWSIISTHWTWWGQSQGSQVLLQWENILSKSWILLSHNVSRSWTNHEAHGRRNDSSSSRRKFWTTLKVNQDMKPLKHALSWWASWSCNLRNNIHLIR